MIAIPLYQCRVAPVLDWCSTVLLIPKHAIESWREGERLRVKMNVFDLLRLFHDRAVSAVICGAVSLQALRFGQHLGLEFVCGISGAIDEVVEAYRAGELDQPRFRLPGCRCAGRSGPLGGPGPDQHTPAPQHIPSLGNRGRGDSKGRQCGRGRGRGCAGTGSAGVDALWVCPHCGMEARDRRGMPCVQAICQVCGSPLVKKTPAPEPPSCPSGDGSL